MKTLIIVGRSGIDEQGRKRGEMARQLYEECQKARIIAYRCGEAPFPPHNGNTVVVYFSSKERFPSILEECRREKLTMIVGSSGIRGEDIPTDVTIPVILAPNLGLLIQALFDVLPRFASLAGSLNPRRVAIAEGHQASKTSAPITAQNIAGMFGIKDEEIGHIRSDAIAESILDIPQSETGAFGAHFLKVTACAVEVKIQFRTLGRQAYFLGLQVILGKLYEIAKARPLDPGIYEAHKLVFPSHPLVEQFTDEKLALKERIAYLETQLDLRKREMTGD